MSVPLREAKGGLSRRAVLTGGIAAAGALGTSAGEGAELCSEVSRWDGEFDVVVVGGGVAGACAANEAVGAGAKVLVVDSGSAAANASHGTIIYMGGGTALQKAGRVDDSPDEMMKYLLASTGPEPDQARTQVFVERSVANFDWLVQRGVPFDGGGGAGSPSHSRSVYGHGEGSLQFTGSELVHPWRELARPAPRGHIPAVPGADSLMRGGGAWIQQRLLDDARRGGAVMLLDAVGRRIVRGQDGVVQGVTATVDGREQSFRARRGLVLATGGFARNAKMVSQHAPAYLGCTPTDLAWNEGWGIRAAQSVGAAVRRMGAADVGWFFHHPASRRQGVLVNALGQRFVPEDSYSGRVGDAIVREQRGVAWLIVDARTMADGGSRVIPDSVAAQAPSIAELERLLEIPRPALQQTVASYNEHASKGEDPVFHKAQPHLRPLSAPPFTAIAASVGQAQLTFFTLGGLHTTPQAEVLDVEGEPIPGLYAAGRVSAGIPCPYYYSSGLSLGECITFGRIAGNGAARNS